MKIKNSHQNPMKFILNHQWQRKLVCILVCKRPGTALPGHVSPMLFESHFKSYFGNVKAFNLKKFEIKIIAEPVAAMAGGGLRLGGDGRRIP